MKDRRRGGGNLHNVKKFPFSHASTASVIPDDDDSATIHHLIRLGQTVIFLLLSTLLLLLRPLPSAFQSFQGFD